jgi:hypothetical protein
MYISFVNGACVLMPLRRNLRGTLKMEIVTHSIAGNPSFSWLVGWLGVVGSGSERLVVGNFSIFEYELTPTP